MNNIIHIRACVASKYDKYTLFIIYVYLFLPFTCCLNIKPFLWKKRKENEYY